MHQKFVLIILFLVSTAGCLSAQDEDKTTHRINFSLGAVSPQAIILNNFLTEEYSDDYYVDGEGPSINLAYERRGSGAITGYGAFVSYNHYQALYEEAFDFQARFEHALFGGSLYFYPDEYLELDKLRLYTRISLGIQYIDKYINKYTHDQVYCDYELTEKKIFPLLSLYAGCRYPISKRFELQAEAGFREVSVFKFGVNFKI